MSKRCKLQKEYYKEFGNYKGSGKYTDHYVNWLESKVLAINYTHSCETVANKENKDFFKWVESEKIERISDFYFLIGNKKHTYNYVKKKYRMYLQKKQMFY